MLPRELVCTAKLLHSETELMEPALLLSSPEIAVILQHPQEGRVCLLPVTVGEESSPAFKRLLGKFPRTCTGNFSSEKPEVPHSMHIWRGIRLKSLGCVHTVHFHVPNVGWFLSTSKATLCTAPTEPNIFAESSPDWEMESYRIDSSICW